MSAYATILARSPYLFEYIIIFKSLCITVCKTMFEDLDLNSFILMLA